MFGPLTDAFIDGDSYVLDTDGLGQTCAFVHYSRLVHVEIQWKL